mgnify:CR=1 FL=1
MRYGKNEILIITFGWVQNEAGMKAYVVARNSTVVLWDFENPVIYIKSASQQKAFVFSR